jgi:8-oxo-dGTP pyrophosphatase MutT (NUDIX family)
LITYRTSDKRFNYRVAGVAIHNSSVLLQGEEQGTNWVLPGGRAELLEPSQETLKREMREELGVEIRVERLLWVVENFFRADGISCHELGFYFQITLLDAPHLMESHLPFPGIEEGLPLVFQWFPLEEIGNVPFYPLVLKRALQAIPTTTEHIVNIEIKDML